MKNKFLVKSVLWLTFLYGVTLGLLLISFFFLNLSMWSSILVFIFLILTAHFISPLLMDWATKLFGSLKWISLNEIPGNSKTIIETLCLKYKIPVPRIGFIDDGSIAAYSYGTRKKNARLIVSRGLFELLDEGEVKAVLTQELGHIIQGDFIYLTLARGLPALLWFIHENIRTLPTINKNGNDEGPKSVSEIINLISTITLIMAIAAGTFCNYLARIRGLAADEFTIRELGNGKSFLNALLKIGYGATSTSSTSDKFQGVRSLMMNSGHSSQTLKLVLQNEKDSQVSNEILAWDVVNPWARIIEFFSEQPRVSRRLENIQKVSIEIGVPLNLNFNFNDRKLPFSYLLNDLFFMLQPLIWGVAFSIIAFYGLKPFGGMKSPLISVALFAICGLSIGILITLVKRYVSLDNPNKVKVTDILKNIEVSDMRCIPVEVRGVVVGRGTAGWQFDPDFYLKDESGLIYIHHDRIKPFSNIVFALKTLNKYMDKTVVIKGWYRRFPTPFIELQSIDDEILNPKKGRLLFWKSLATFALILTLTFTWFDQSESIPFSSMSSLSFTSIIDIKGKQMTCIVDQMKKEYSDFPGTVDGVAFAELMNDKIILRVTLPVANSSKKVSDNYFIEFISDSEQGWENSFGSFLTTKVKSKANVFDNKNNKLFVLNLLPCKEEL